MVGERILLVENAGDFGPFSLEDVLFQAGYDVMTASDGDEGYRLAGKLRPDLMIADYHLPHRDGLAMQAALYETGLPLPFILVSTVASAEESAALALKALRLGCDDYLPRPFSPEELLESVRRVLHVQWMRRHVITEDGLLAPVLYNATEIIIVTDAQQQMQFCNRVTCQVFNVPEDVYQGRALATVIDHPEVIELFEKSARTRQNYSGEITLDGGESTFNAQLTLVDGVGQVAVMQDITHLKERDRAKSDFVTTVSHDLRSPLTSIMGYVELLNRTGPLNDSQQEYSERITDSVRSIAKLIEELLELGKIEAGLERDREPTDLGPIVEHAIEHHHHQWKSKRQIISCNVQENLLPVLGNPLRLRQVVNNLVENATKYTPEEGQIHVTLEQNDQFLVLHVADSGIGIAPEDQPHVFDKFYRTGEAIEHYPGTGLGLAIVKGIVEAHGGRIWVNSQVGSGSTFTVMLPCCEPDS